MDAKVGMNYPKILRNFRQIGDETKMINTALDKLAEEMEPLQTADTCLSVGTGFGEYDILFIKRFLPNLKKLIAVEKDRNCTAELKVNLVRDFGAELQIEIHEMSIESFTKRFSTLENGINKKVDVVLAFHSLYELGPQELRMFLQSCIRLWLKPVTGLFATVHNIRKTEDCRGNLPPTVFITMEDIEVLLKSFGLLPLNDIPIRVTLDANELRLAVQKDIFKPGSQESDEGMAYGVNRLVERGIDHVDARLSVFGEVCR